MPHLPLKAWRRTMPEASRQDLRLDEEQRRMLEALADRERATVSDVLRRMIDKSYAAELRRRRIEAAELLVSLELDDVPDPEELARILDEALDARDLY